ncbi:MAG: tetratricopeptide repeat protein [Gloeomargarita sp. SKYB31]|nr:tetratricopeptide repeat protein [Gloeomargarita sp. SKYB31]
MMKTRYIGQWLGVGLSLVFLGVTPAFAQKSPLSPALQTYFDHLERGQEALTLREYTVAVAAFTQAIQVQPQRFEAYYQRGQAYSFLGQDAAALADAEKAIRLNPQYAPAYTLRGLLRFRHRKELEPALADLNQSLALDPQQAAVYGLRGTIKRQMQDIAGAIADFEQGIQVARARKQFSLYKALERELERTRQLQPR